MVALAGGGARRTAVSLSWNHFNMSHSSSQEPSLVDRLMKMVFSGRLTPGSSLLEKDLATELGLSRTPIRETLARLVGHGALVPGRRGEGVRLRDYSCEEVYQLYEFRALLEGGAAAAAAKTATPADIERMKLILDMQDSETQRAQFYPEERWAELDYAFHIALAEASHNERIAQSLKVLLAESHYLFYRGPSRRLEGEQARAEMKRVADDHHALFDLVREGDAEGAEARARADMRKSSQYVCAILVHSRDVRT